MKNNSSQVDADRQLLADAQAKGTKATLGAYVKLSGPGWLQSAITLGGGSLSGALFLGALGGTGMLWLQLMAIVMGVIMLSAISYVTLSTGERPFQAINKHINPALGWGWLIATSMANMIWCMPQFSLCYDALDKNLVPGGVEQYLPAEVPINAAPNAFVIPWPSLIVSALILFAVTGVVTLNARQGTAAKIFDRLLRGLVGMVVVCFFGVVAFLSISGVLNWGEILAGFIPDFSQWNGPSGKVAALISNLPSEASEFWRPLVVDQQRGRMIAAAASAVGINMTFLLPYSMLRRGWGKQFRGLARFDLSTSLAIPYIVVTSCVVIAAAHAFHGKADEAFLNTDSAIFQTSPTFKGTKDILLERIVPDAKGEKFDDAIDGMSEAEKEQLIAQMAALPDAEKKIAASMVQRNASQLSQTLAPLFGANGERIAGLVFGVGVFAMGFSTIIILMLINGYVFCEVMGKPEGVAPYVMGCLVAGVMGALWPFFWTGASKFYLAIVASQFGMMLLPIAYVTFFMMMNSRSLMGDAKPTGTRLIVWNVLMGVSVVGAIVAASGAIWQKINDKGSPMAILGSRIVLGMLIVYAGLIVVGFLVKRKPTGNNTAT